MAETTPGGPPSPRDASRPDDEARSVQPVGHDQSDATGPPVSSFREEVDARIAELDERQERRLSAQLTALTAALRVTEQAATAALAASEIKLFKAEMAAIDGLGKRMVNNPRLDATVERVDDINGRVVSLERSCRAMGPMYVYVVAYAGLAAAIVALAFRT